LVNFVGSSSVAWEEDSRIFVKVNAVEILCESQIFEVVIGAVTAARPSHTGHYPVTFDFLKEVGAAMMAALGAIKEAIIIGILKQNTNLRPVNL